MKFKCQHVLILLITFFQIVSLNGSRPGNSYLRASSGHGQDSSSVASKLSSGVTEIFSTHSAFAALKEDGSIVTWGNGNNGGDSTSVASELCRGVIKICSNDQAFAALKEDGSVITWGTDYCGGDSSSVAPELSSGVTEIFSSRGSFAALKNDGSVVTWGYSDGGGDSSSVASELTSGVTEIFSTNSAFAALKQDGSVVTWGDERSGGDNEYQHDEHADYYGIEWTIRMKMTSALNNLFRDKSLRNVVTITSNNAAFAAVKENGSAVTWGLKTCGGDSQIWLWGYGYFGPGGSVARELRNGVVEIFSTSSAFAALKDDGSVVTWGAAGEYNYGAISSDVASDLRGGVVKIFSTFGAFAALKEDGSVIVWGDTTFGGLNSSFKRFSEALKITSGVVEIFSTSGAFAALKEDGSVVTW